MRLLLTILFFSTLSANATTYYVAVAGNDANNGITTGTAWRTIAKAVASTVAFDSILLNKGDTWNERVVPGVAHLYFGSYGTGVKPVITALQTQTGFTNVGNVWMATATNSVPSLNIVLIGGVICAKGRFPNTGYLSYTTASTNLKIVGALTGFPDYTGAELAVRSSPWVIDVVKIASQVADTFNLATAMTYSANQGANGYFIQNIPAVLDTLNEWCYDPISKVIKVWANSSPSVQISTIDTLVWINSLDYVTFDGISFTGANKAAFQYSANHITIKNCTINYSGLAAVAADNSAYTTISKDTIQNTLSTAISLVNLSSALTRTCDFAIVDSNYIKNSGTISGMGGNGIGQYQGMYVVGLSPVITNNKVVSTGYTSIYFNGQTSLVKNNLVDSFGIVKDDGGGIYTFIGGFFPHNYDSGSIIRSNIVRNGLGSASGLSTADTSATGLYMDNLVNHITVDSNTVFNCRYSGVSCNQCNSINLLRNTVTNGIGSCMVFSNFDDTGLVVKGNTLYSQSATRLVIWKHVEGFAGNNIDSNYYLRPVLETAKFQMFNTAYSLAAWVTATGYDTHSVSTPSGITAALPLLPYNPNQSDSTYSFTDTYYNAKGLPYTNSVVLKSGQSEILFKAITNLPYVTGSRNRFRYKKVNQL